MANETPTVIELAPNAGFVQTPEVRQTVRRALSYIRAGYPMHFRGPAGTGKTTLALHVAACLKRPVVLIHGDEEFTTSDLVGGEHGYHFRKVVDNFISRVKKTEEDMMKRWVDNRLTVACKLGFTLVYDEYTRSRPEANNILLSILQDRIMDIPLGDGDQDPYLKVHPDFTAIFTSNPEEYAGVHRSQDALRDRMITIDLDHYDYDTEVAIVQAKSKLPKHDCEIIVRIMRQLRDSGKCEYEPTIRSAIMIAKTLKIEALTIARSNGFFKEVCEDILSSQTSRVGSKTNQNIVREYVGKLIEDDLKKSVEVPIVLRDERQSEMLASHRSPGQSSPRSLGEAGALAELGDARQSSAMIAAPHARRPGSSARDVRRTSAVAAPMKTKYRRKSQKKRKNKKRLK